MMGIFVEEGSTARWVNPESPSRPAVALSFFVVMLVVINHQKYFLPTHLLTILALVHVDGHHGWRLAFSKPAWCPLGP